LPERFPARPIHAIILLGLLLASLPALGVAAQAQLDLQLTAQAGFDGYCKENRWIPVKVNVENSGPDLQARLQVEYGNGPSATSAYGTDLDLPTGSRKEFFLYLYPNAYLDELNINLLVNGKTRLKNALKISCISTGNLLIGLLADNPADYASLGDAKPLAGFTRVSQLRASDLPDQAQGWEALDALVVAGADTGTLSAEQRAALGLWLAEGGKLLIVGGINWQPGVAGLGEFLPLDPESTQSIASLSALSTYFKTDPLPETTASLTTGTLRPGAEVLIAQAGLPLLVRREIGFGEVYFLAADPALQPLSDWDGMETLYSHLLAVQVAPPRWAQWPWESYAADNALATLPELGLPSFVLICGWLGFYLLMIGPANYFLLRRLKRPELGWLTVPGLVALFTGIAYFSGFLYRGGQPTLNRLMIVQSWEGVEQAQAHAVLGIYSPRRTRYTLEAEAPFKFLPYGSSGAALQADGNWLSLQQGSNNLLPETRLEIGGMRAVGLNGSLPALKIEHNLTITLSPGFPVLAGEVTNRSSVTLKDAILVTPGSFKRLGDLAPGTTQQVSLLLKMDRNDPGFYQTNTFPTVYSGLPNPSEDETTRRRNALLQAAVLPQQYNQVPSNWGIYLLGWIDSPMLPAGLSQASFKTVDTTLYFSQLNPEFKFETETWQVPSSLFAWESSNPNNTPYSSSDMPADGYTLRFRPVLPAGSFSQVQALDLTIDCATTPDKVVVSLWDYERQRWSPVEISNWGEINVPAPAPYLGPGGEIQLKLDSVPNEWFDVLESSVKLVVGP